ncbi:MAG: glutamate racemase [candidate division Zixibacteria bacterium]|nr:glutamate racemase [candidate division Zixibacteria bacterium]MDH3939248.1 glutamate racemase [candidate division Zixibacteria bacterium]MDH4033572.1 glutamate racemase [candidate division Zixibacteria bacterium]
MTNPSSTSNNAPIGVFDSGVGGLTVARQLYKLLPHEDVVYFGDVGRTPYGGRSKEIIRQFTLQDVAFLIEHDVKLIICACNSASSVALGEVAKEHEVGMLGVIEPGAQAAVARTTNGRVGVIGTNATIGSNAYASTIHRIDPKIKVFSLACPLFVPLAEEGYLDKDATYLIARDYLQTMHDVDIDTLVLGCTHYPLLRQVIADVMGDKVTLIDSGEETARVAFSTLTDRGLLRTDEQDASAGTRQYFVSDVPEKFGNVAGKFLGEPIDKITRVDISGY